MGADHGHDGPPAAKAVRRLLVALIVPLALGTIVGLVTLWPRSATAVRSDALTSAPTVRATVGTVGLASCSEARGGSSAACEVSSLTLTSGPDDGRHVTLERNLAAGVVKPLHDGDRIVVQSFTIDGALTYEFVDVQRGRPLLLLAVLFAVLVVALARWKGVAALVGLAVTLLVLVRFVLPAIVQGSDPVLVSIVGAAVVLFAVFYLGFGLNVRSSTALAGTLLSLAVTGGLAVAFVGLTHLTGTASEDAITVAATAGQVNLRGLLLGGTIIGSLGVLNDVTITQASAVWQLHLTDPDAGARTLYRRAMEVGRDHIGATVDTLVLAYAGASMPLLVTFTLAGRGVLDVVTSAAVAEEVVRSLVGAIGLVLSVPITTVVAALLAARSTSATEDTGRSGPDHRTFAQG